MSFNILTLRAFDKEIKALSKKYPSLKSDFSALLGQLEANPFLGTPLGRNCYKIRMQIRSKSKGKSSGARLITCVKIIRRTVYLVAVFDKSDFTTLTDNELKQRLKQIPPG